MRLASAVIKVLALAIYLAAVTSLFWPVPAGEVLRMVTLVVFVGHVLEGLVLFRYLKTWNGPLFHSVLLCLLFGLLHWGPLVWAARQRGRFNAT